MGLPAAGVIREIPVDLTREQAHRLAELELADPAYRAARPGLVQRAIEWIVERVQEIVARVGDAAPGGWLGVLGLALVILVAVLFIRWRLGPVGGSGAVTFTVDPSTTAGEYRRLAEVSARRGDWDRAVSARMSALVRCSQERGLIDHRAGWTADEVARAVSASAPGSEQTMRMAAGVFDDVRYGGRPAQEASYGAIVAADELVERVGGGIRR